MLLPHLRRLLLRQQPQLPFALSVVSLRSLLDHCMRASVVYHDLWTVRVTLRPGGVFTKINSSTRKKASTAHSSSDRSNKCSIRSRCSCRLGAPPVRPVQLRRRSFLRIPSNKNLFLSFCITYVHVYAHIRIYIHVRVQRIQGLVLMVFCLLILQEVVQLGGRPVEELLFTMSNYFSMGIESRIGRGFDRHRTKSQTLNKMV